MLIKGVKRYYLFFEMNGPNSLSLVEIGPAILKNKTLKFLNVFSLFRYYIPLENGGALHLNKLESPSPKDALCRLVEIGEVVLKKILKVCLCMFAICYYLPLEKVVAFHMNNLESSSPKDALCQVWL